MNRRRNTARSTVAAAATVMMVAAALISVSDLTLMHISPVDATRAHNNDNNDDSNSPSQQQEQEQEEQQYPTAPSQNMGISPNSGSDGSDSGNGVDADFPRQQRLTTLAAEGGASSSSSTNAACGQVVSGVVNLTSNLDCSGDGLIVGGPNTVINMNGFSISGPGQESSKVGIMVPNVDNVAVNGPGSLSNFQAGVLLTGANGFKIDSVILSNNQIGTFMTGAENAQIQQNIVQDNSIGIASHSSRGAAIDSNLMSGNVLAGVTFVNTQQSSLGMNNIHGSQNGAFLDGQSSQNSIADNNVLQNVIDLNNANGLPTNINVNQYTENNCEASNPSGLCIGR
jgi:parallel beta-helix repeat protein